MKRMRLLTLLTVATIALPAHAVVESSDKAFFPTDQGDEWVYKTTQKEKKTDFDMRVVIEGLGRARAA